MDFNVRCDIDAMRTLYDLLYWGSTVRDEELKDHKIWVYESKKTNYVYRPPYVLSAVVDFTSLMSSPSLYIDLMRYIFPYGKVDYQRT